MASPTLNSAALLTGINDDALKQKSGAVNNKGALLMFDCICLSAAPFCAHHYMIIIGLIFRIPTAQAVKARVTVGIGFVGMGLAKVIVMAIDSLQSAD